MSIERLQAEFDKIVRETFPAGTEALDVATYLGLVRGFAIRLPQYDLRHGVRLDIPVHAKVLLPLRANSRPMTMLREWVEAKVAASAPTLEANEEPLS